LYRSEMWQRFIDNSLKRRSVCLRTLTTTIVEPKPGTTIVEMKPGFDYGKLAIIGGGKMSEAIIGALNQKALQTMANIVVYDIHQPRLSYLQIKYGVSIASDIKEAVDGSEITILAVRPQNMSVLLNSPVKIPGLLLSVCAGVTIKDLQSSFDVSTVVRSMPNTPSMIQEGISVWMATPETTPLLKEKAQFLLQTLGEEIEVDEEKYLDMATAISGSGPAYVFLAMEAMIDTAVHLGFQREIASRLVVGTIRGSAVYAQKSGQHATKLKNDATTPNGATASALYELEKGGIRTVMADAIWASHRRSLEMGGLSSNVGPGRSKA